MLNPIKKIKPGLRAKFFSALFIIAFFNLIFFSIVIYTNRTQDILNSNKSLAIEEISRLSQNINRALQRNEKNLPDIKSAEDFVKAMLENIPYAFSLHDELGKKIYSSSADFSVPQTEIAISIKRLSSDMSACQKPDMWFSDNSLSMNFLVPLTHQNVNFHFYTRLDKSSITSDMAKLNFLILATGIFLLIIFTVFSIVMYRLFITPLNRLMEHSTIELNNAGEKNEFSLIIDSINSLIRDNDEKASALKRITESISHEMEVMLDIHNKILPKIQVDKKFNYSVFHKASGKLSGDYYDAIKLDNARNAFVVASASTSGIIAAEMKLLAKNLFHKYARIHSEPGQVMKYVNSEATDILRKHEKLSALYYSAFFLSISHNNAISYCGAGLKAVLIKLNQKKIRLLDTGGFVLGVSKDMNSMFKSAGEQLEQGDRILLFTDGLTETKNEEGEEFGIQKVLESVKKNHSRNVDELMVGLMDEFYAHIHFTDPPKDISLFIVEIK